MLLASFALATSALAADKLTAPQLIHLATSNPHGLADGIWDSFDAKSLKAGTAWAGRGPDIFFAAEASTKPLLFLDGAAGPEMRPVEESGFWYAVASVTPVGTSHSFHYTAGGVKFGGSPDVPVFGPLSYQQPGVPSGALSAKTHISKIYDGLKSDYWIYVPSQYDPNAPAALMVFQDGGGYINRDSNNPALNAIDNLIAQKKIPLMICVFINPGDIAGSAGTPTYRFVKTYGDKWQRTLKDSMRSTLYDTVSDRYARFLRDEVLAEVQTKYNIRKDAYSRAIMGGSSGGICAFNAAWQMPDQFSRVISWIGSFVSIQWKEDPNNPDGGQDYPNKVLREDKRNIRVWLQDGNQDMAYNWFERHYGSWPLANLRMANALKLADYDFHFSFGKGMHSGAQGAAEFPAEMIWLWRMFPSGR